MSMHSKGTRPGHVPAQHKPVKFAFAALLLLATLRSAAGVPAAATADGLRPGEFSWTPDLAPRGPVAVIVSLPAQRAYVYRNGTRIGISTVSTGKRGKETPAGIYTILEKKREHYSNLYDDAPMPYMQRLTWGGIAMHAGKLPGYPASHGCVRLPMAFAQQLYATTTAGTVVVVADTASSPYAVVSPGLFAPIDTATGSPRTAPPASYGAGWFPERSPAGPLTILLSTADQELVVLRNAIEIGRTPVTIDPTLVPVGMHAYMLLETVHDAAGAAASQTSRRWQVLSTPATAGPATAGLSDERLRAAFQGGQIAVPGDFRRAVRAVLQPGATLVLTDEPLRPPGDTVDVLSTNDAGPR